MNKEEILNIKLKRIVKPFYVKVTLALMLVSYFYNLPIIKYSLTGDNEFRLYDVCGIVLLFVFIKNYSILKYYINSIKQFRLLKSFMLWCLITFFVTILFAVYNSKTVIILQSVLYYFHFVTFFLTALYFSILLKNSKYYKYTLHIIFILIIASGLVIIGQHTGLVPFLWAEEYRRAYNGFLSGTFGPNKIVTGMIMLMSFMLCIAVYIQKGIKVNKILLLSALLMSAVIVALSGSRTTYLGVGVFAVYFLITNTGKFLKFSMVIVFAIAIAIYFNLGVVDLVTNVFDDRVTNKITDPTLLQEGSVDVDLLYEDLGSGRKGLSLMYIKYLLQSPYVIPFGVGFNNRMLIGSSAHNIYLTLINEVGLVGVFLYFRWLFSYYFINLGRAKHLKTILRGLIVSMAVTLFFGEHLYIYRPLFGILGFFLLITVLLIVPRYYFKNDK
ncbi:O-antigen ligase family protein [Lacinutrix salivirga]